MPLAVATHIGSSRSPRRPSAITPVSPGYTLLQSPLRTSAAAIVSTGCYLLHLREFRQCSSETLKPVVSALRFFYYVTLAWPCVQFAIPSPPPSRKPPHVLSRQEVERLFAGTENRRDRTLLMTTYAAGLRGE